MTEIAIVGVLAIVGAAIVLMKAVFTELGPAGGLTGQGRWLLAVAFGMGVIAFAAKLMVLGAFSAVPPEALQQLGALFARPLQALPSALGSEPPVPDTSPRYTWQPLPEQAPAPPDNPLTAAKVALGEKLFFDKNLSKDRSVACASCHDLFNTSGADGLRTATGIGGQKGGRNSPTVWNAAFQARLFWDGRAASLEEQAKGPPVNPIEMGMPSLDAVAQRVTDNPAYRPAFDAAFGPGSAITIDRIAQAIASFERTLITPDSAFDRFVRGDAQALTAEQRRGMGLFDSLGCVQCHSGPNFSGASLLQNTPPLRLFPANPLPLDPALHLTEDLGGNADATGQIAQQDRRGLWRIPSLRNVALTAPYFHNGAVDKLEDAVRIMAQAQLGLALETNHPDNPSAHWSDKNRTMSLAGQRVLTEREVADLVAFLNALSSDRLLQEKNALRRVKPG